MLDDGVYELSFVGCGEDASCRSDGFAVLRDGHLLGSDRNGGVFRGHCRYDAVERCAVVEVRLIVPPNGVLLTGHEAGPDGALIDVAGRFPLPKPVSTTVVTVAGAQMEVELRFMGPLGA